MAVKGQRNNEGVMEVYEEGNYVLTVDRWTTAKEENFVRGDVVFLDEAEATRLGNGRAIAPVGSMEARRAQIQAIPDDDERKTKMMLLDAEALEEKAKKLRESAGEGVEERKGA